MTVRERILAIRLMDQQEKKPAYFEKLGVRVIMNEAEAARPKGEKFAKAGKD